MNQPDLQAMTRHCENQSRFIAGLVAEHGGYIRRQLCDIINTKPGFIPYGVRDEGEQYVEVVLGFPLLTVFNETHDDAVMEVVSELSN